MPNPNFLQNLFAKNVTIDDRNPIIAFSVPEVSLFAGWWKIEGGRWGLLMPMTSFYVHIFTLFFIQTSFAVMVAVLMYYFVILPQKNNKKQKEEGHTDSSIVRVLPLLITFGITLPLLLIEPFWIMDYLSIKSSASKMMVMGLPLSVSLRILEAYYGCTPDAAKKSLSTFVIYMSCLACTVSIDKSKAEFVPTAKPFLYQRIKEFARTYLIMFVLFSYLAPIHFYPFEESRDHSLGSLDYKLMDIFAPYHLFGNFLLALTLSMSLDWSTTGLSLVYNLMYGVQSNKVVLNPMLKSESPSHFWGRRWNTTIHEGLKGGIYKPMRTNGYSKVLAVLITFLGSGVLHEYNIYFLFQGHDDDNNDEDESTLSSFSIRYGKNIIFFGWNGILVMMESLWLSSSNIRTFQKLWGMKKSYQYQLPSTFRTALVILSALPVAHLFLDDWIEVGYFRHVQVGMPLLVQL